jgi:beta-glucoside operon transcriptional antiterminator
MKILQLLNNNIALVDRGGNEVIVYAKGLAFRKKVGQRISEDEIEKIYVLDSTDRLEHFSYLISQTDDDVLVFVNDLVDYAEKTLTKKASDYLYLALLDHVSFAIKRAKEGQFIRSPLAWEVRKFYPQHFAVGLEAVKMMSQRFNLEFPEDEAVSIALHFVNMQENANKLGEKLEDMDVLNDMLNIIKYHFKIVFDEDGLSYSRLVTHLQFFIERLHTARAYNDVDTEFNNHVKSLYPEAYAAVEKLEIYVLGRFKQTMTDDEKTYLTLHINRVTNRKD